MKSNQNKLVKPTLENFIQQWDKQFNDLKNILNYIDSYENQGLCLHPKLKFANPNNLNQIQDEWLWLLGKLEHDTEKAYFKSYWIPVTSENYDFFIDISQPNFPLFEVHYNCIHYNWFKTYFTRDISELLMAIPLSDEDAEKFRENRMNELTNKLELP